MAQRHPWDPIVLTALPNVICGLVAPFPYSAIILASSATSIAWHLEHEPITTLFWINYSLTFLWSLYDIVQLGGRGYLLNMIAITTHYYSNRYPYEKYHSLWQLYSCILTVYKIDLMWSTQKVDGLQLLLSNSTTPSYH